MNIYKTPIIYAYSDNNPKYKGLLKVGYTTGDVRCRVAQQYPVLRPDGQSPYQIVVEATALKDDGSAFTDTEVHYVLEQMGLTRCCGEWFKCTAEDVRNAIRRVQSGKIDSQQKPIEIFTHTEAKNILDGLPCVISKDDLIKQINMAGYDNAKLNDLIRNGYISKINNDWLSICQIIKTTEPDLLYLANSTCKHSVVTGLYVLNEEGIIDNPTKNITVFTEQKHNVIYTKYGNIFWHVAPKSTLTIEIETCCSKEGHLYNRATPEKALIDILWLNRTQIKNIHEAYEYYNNIGINREEAASLNVGKLDMIVCSYQNNTLRRNYVWLSCYLKQ